MNQKHHKIKLLLTIPLLYLSFTILWPHHSSVYALESSVSIAAPSAIDLEILPTAAGNISSESANISITTSQTASFRVLVNTTEQTNLTNKFHPSSPISSFSTATPLNTFPLNTWGIYLGSSTPNNSFTFSPLSTTPTEMVNNDLANASGTYKLAIGAKVDTSLPAGMYSNTIIISVLAEPPEITSLAEATYLQEVTPEICSNSNLEQAYTLTDKRDSKVYNVAKLRDGNCWFQEDLKLSLSTNTPLTSNNSNILPDKDGSTHSWTPNNNTNNGLVNATDTTDNGRSWIVNGHYYYQYSALVAGTNPNYNETVTESICPKGWELPTFVNSVEHGDYYGLMNAYSSTSLNSQLLGFVATGAVNTDRGAIGEAQGMLVWSGTPETSNSARILYALYFPVVGSAASTFTTLPRGYGAVARCVAIKAK